MAEVLKGNLSQLPLLDILKVLSSSRRSGRLELEHDGKTGEVYLQDGNLVHAVTGSQMGEAAVYSLMAWVEGDLRFFPEADAPEESISLTTEQMLLEAGRRAEQWEDIKKVVPTTDMVFSLSPSGSTSTVSLKPREWQVLAQVDGKRSVLDIAEILEMDEFDTAKMVYSLVTAGLLQEEARTNVAQQELMGESFFERLQSEFTEIMGPLAPVIIEDEISMLGETRKNFPRRKAAELVERISLEIQNEEQRTRFQGTMLNELNAS
ncbi:MAG: DUF4388 domain-containing protein [Anaerolineales bacterium]|nr:DUF4388 domain-containing protein [Anaerolineales bacterium]